MPFPCLVQSHKPPDILLRIEFRGVGWKELQNYPQFPGIFSCFSGYMRLSVVKNQYDLAVFSGKAFQEFPEKFPVDILLEKHEKTIKSARCADYVDFLFQVVNDVKRL